VISSQIKSKQRVMEHGEVLTGEREVTAMLDLVQQETERIESRFLEPACGTGNFLAEILRRKLNKVTERYGSSPLEWERNAVLAVSSLYGIDIQEDNVLACRERLAQIVHFATSAPMLSKVKPPFYAAVRFVLSRNIIHGDALTLQTVGPNPAPIVFSEWSPVSGSLFKRRDFIFKHLFRPTESNPFDVLQKGLFGEEQSSLFGEPNAPPASDIGGTSFIPEPLRDFPLVHYLELAHAQ
jgi:hypothetical protein